MSSQPFEVETVVLTREYLESLHGRMTFNAASDDDDEEDEAPAPVAPRSPGGEGRHDA